MDPRDVEAAMLARCAAVAKQLSSAAQNQREANVFLLAGMVIETQFPAESHALISAGQRYFVQHPEQELAPADVVRKGWILGLPRLRDMLSRELTA